jgi:Tfp pilus assembly protein FimT
MKRQSKDRQITSGTCHVTFATNQFEQRKNGIVITTNGTSMVNGVAHIPLRLTKSLRQL